jgi:hypothetical protein
MNRGLRLRPPDWSRAVDTLLDRFCRYVKIETTSVEDTDRGWPTFPSASTAS